MSVFDLKTVMDAARLAREKSTEGRSIYILITEEGFIVRGDRPPFTSALDVSWPEMDMNPGLLANAVYLVAGRLRAD